MSPNWISNRKQRRKKQQLAERPVLQLPVARPDLAPSKDEDEDETKVDRGVAVIDFYI